MRAVQHRDSAVVVSLPFRASSVRNARARLTGDLLRAEVPDRAVDDVRIVVSELIGNSVRHATALPSGRLLVAWRLESDAVVLSVTDGGSKATAPHVVHPHGDAVGGRGMTIVEALSRRWWVQHGADSSTITAEIAVR